MFNIGVGLLNRLSTLLALKALPDEAALQDYIYSVFKGMAFLIIGSVLLGTTITASLYLAYDQMLNFGYSKIYVQIITIGTSIMLMAICFILANKLLSQRFCVKPESKGSIDEKLNHLKDITSESITGFIEGLCDRPSKDRR